MSSFFYFTKETYFRAIIPYWVELFNFIWSVILV